MASEDVVSTAKHSRSGGSVAATVVGLGFGCLTTLLGCVLILSPIIGFSVLAWAMPFLGSGIASWRRHTLARTLARVSLLVSFGVVCLLSLVAGTAGSFDIDDTVGLFLFWSILFMTLPLVQVVLTSWAWRRTGTPPSSSDEPERVRQE